MTLMMVSMLSIGFISCGGDDDEAPGGNEQVESPEDNLPESSKGFVGYWRNSQDNLVTSNDFVFFGDGSCDRYNTYNGRFLDGGYWTFNDITKILATTVGEWQWEVTLSNSETWAGLSLGSAKTQTFKRDDSRYALAYLRNTVWEYDTLTTMTLDYCDMHDISISFNSDDYESLKKMYKYPLSRYMYITDASISKSNIIAKYTIRDSYEFHYIGGSQETRTRDIDTGTITIKNYNRSNASIILSKNPDHEFKLKRD